MTSRPPPAPTKSRKAPVIRAATTTTTTRSSRTTATTSAAADQLADDLGNNLSISSTSRTKQPARPTTATTTRRVPPTTTSSSSSRGLKSTTTPTPSAASVSISGARATAGSSSRSSSKTATTSATTASVSRGTTKVVTREQPAEEEEEDDVLPVERAREAMRTINTSLSTLSSLAKSGWKTPAPTSTGTTTTTTSRRPVSSTNTTTTTPSSPEKQKQFDASLKLASDGFKLLRKLIREKKVGNRVSEVERAAGSLVGSLVEMGFYLQALQELSHMRTSLITSYSPSPPSPLPTSTSLLSYTPLLHLPLPSSTYPPPQTLSQALSITSPLPTLLELIPLVLVIQQYVFGCLFRSANDHVEVIEVVGRVLREEGGGPLEWRGLLERVERGEGEGGGEKEKVEKRLEGMLVSMFGSLTKGCVGVDGAGKVSPSTLLHLRSTALIYYATTLSSSTPSEKFSSFHDQTRKVVLLYGRQSESNGVNPKEVCEEVKGVWERVMECLDERGVGDKGRSGKGWRDLGEVVLHVARRAEDVLFVERISLLLDGSTTAEGEGGGGEIDPEQQTSALCAKMLSAMSVVELWLKTGEDKGYLAQLTRIISLIPLLTRLRTSFTTSQHSTTKIDKLLERLRYVVARKIKNGRRLDQCVSKDEKEKEKEGGEEDGGGKEMRKVLESFVRHAEEVIKVHPPKSIPTLTTGVIEVLLLLSYTSLSLSDRSTHHSSFTTLSKTLPFLSYSSSSPSPSFSSSTTNIIALSTVASAFYNIAGTIYNSQGLGEGVGVGIGVVGAGKFAEVSAGLSGWALEGRRDVGEEEEEEGKGDGDELVKGLEGLKLGEKGKEAEEEEEEEKNAWRDLEKYATRRWDLVAMCAGTVGDKKAAYSAYISSLSSLPSVLLSSLSLATSTHPPSTLLSLPAFLPLHKTLQRIIKLGIFDLLLPSSELIDSLRGMLRGKRWNEEAKGMVLEGMLSVVEGTQATVGGQGEEREKAMERIVEVLLSEEMGYGAMKYPMRRARVLLVRMQQLCSPSNGTGKKPNDLGVVACAAEIEELVQQESKGSDSSLVVFAPQYLSLSHLWLAFHAHQSSQLAMSSSASNEVEKEARTALKVLRKALEGDLPGSPSATVKVEKGTPEKTVVKKTVKSAPAPLPPTTATTRRTTTVSKAVKDSSTSATAAAKDKVNAFKTPRVGRTLPGGGSRRIPVGEPITPPSRQLVNGVVPPTQSSPKRTPVRELQSGAGILMIDDVEKTYGMFETMAHLLGSLGFSLLKMGYLKFLRRLASKRQGSLAQDGFVLASSYLGHEYLRLGKTSRAGLVFAQAETRVKNYSNVSPAVQVTYLCLYAEYLATLGNHDRSSQAYDQALSLAETLIPDETVGSISSRIIERTLLLQRSAQAASVCSVMLQRRGDLGRSLPPAMQALRVYVRALSNISRLSSKEVFVPGNNASLDTFNVPPPSDPNAPLSDFPTLVEKKRHSVFSTGPSAGLAWQLAQSLASAMLRIALLHSIRGTPKSAEFYADQAIDFAHNLGSLRLVARALAVRVEVRLNAGKLEEAKLDLEMMERALGSAACPEAIEAHRLRADLAMRQSLAADAHRGYLTAQQSLDHFVQDAADGEAGQSPTKHATPSKHLSPVQHRSAVKFAASPLGGTSPSPSLGASRGAVPADWILPTVQAYILRMRVALLRIENKIEESQALLHRLSKLGISEEDKAAEFKLLASIQFQDLLLRFTTDPVLGMLPESVLSMPTLGAPLVAPIKTTTPRSVGAPSILNCLKEVETLLSRAVAFSVSRAEPFKLRELSLLTATLRALQTSIGKPSRRSAASVAHVLDLGLAVTLRREMLDAIDTKIADSGRQDDLTWPSLDTVSHDDDLEDPDADSRVALSSSAALVRYWRSTRERYRSEVPDPSLTELSLSALLPSHWTTVSIHLSSERDALLLVRHRREAEPLVFKLPLDRLARREGEDESFTYDIAAEELKDIIRDSDRTSKEAKNVEGKEGRLAWWKERKELDMRLKSLTESIEDDWLGAFKSIFCDARHISSEAFATFKSRIERILKRSIVRAAQDKKAAKFKLDDTILECMAALPPTSREEDLEDLFFFMMESFQFTGVPVACDETDVDQVVCDIRTALEELHGPTFDPKPSSDSPQHIFLILDKAVQSFPWESIPILRGRSISRIPSLAFLRDRIDLARLRSPSTAATTTDSIPDIVVDASKTKYILNPGGDLKNTQKSFEPWLDNMGKKMGWSGIVGRAPSDDEVKSSLLNSELVLYFGHGGAEQYIRSQTIRNLPRCAVTMLWGCSSGLLKDQGDFDPVGTPYNYMIAGCPALVANLWDVTDKDIDKLSENVFRLLGLDSADASSTATTLAGAVAQSRDVPLLKFLNGAACVVYGVPVLFTKT